MPQRHRANGPVVGPNGPLKAHARTSSGSKIGLNVHHLSMAQRDPPKLKRAGTAAGLPAGAVEKSAATHLHPRALHGHVNNRVASREQMANIHLTNGQSKRAPQSKRPLAQGHVQGHKVDFSLSGSGGTDDDEWISSESGAVTPIGDSDDDEVPVNANPKKVDHSAPSTTPRATDIEPSLQRVDTARPSQMSIQEQANAQTLPTPPEVKTGVSELTTRVQTAPSLPDIASSSTINANRGTRSQAPSPPSSKRRLLTRQSSTHSEHIQMPPHPLIRGQSFHGSITSSRLAPLTVTNEAAQAQISSSPPKVTSTTASPILACSPSKLGLNERRTSVSSSHSAATLPASTTILRASSMYHEYDRARTMSHLSASPSSAALSSLTALPKRAYSRPNTPPAAFHSIHLPPEHVSQPDGVHPLIPPPYLPCHLTVLTHNNALRASYERVMRARKGR